MCFRIPAVNRGPGSDAGLTLTGSSAGGGRRCRSPGMPEPRPAPSPGCRTQRANRSKGKKTHFFAGPIISKSAFGGHWWDLNSPARGSQKPSPVSLLVPRDHEEFSLVGSSRILCTRFLRNIHRIFTLYLLFRTRHVRLGV